MMNAYDQAVFLQKALHNLPEASGQEQKTKAVLMGFLNGVQGLTVVDKGAWFYAVHREGNTVPSVGFRAEMDAIADENGQIYHGCGHDGHCAIVAALAAWTAGKTLGKNVYFVFQHAEETGEGAKACAELFGEENVDALFGFHNTPGYPEGTVLLLPHTVACASRGLTLRFSGKQSHAADPNAGNNPIFPMSEFFSKWQELTDASAFDGMVLATPIYMNAGSHTFGVAAGSGEIGLTLRSWYNSDLEKLEQKLVNYATELAEQYGVLLTHETHDVFYATVNDPKIFRRCETAIQKAGLSAMTLSEPFRSSDDFGRFCSFVRTCYIGIGSGEQAAPLHTPGYQWNNAVTDTALKLFQTIILN